MYRRPSKKQLLVRRIIVLIITIISIGVIVTGIILFILGYRLDSGNGRLEQGALVQFDSLPTGANVTIDGTSTNTQTPTKRSLIAGAHNFIIQKDGYHAWARSLDINAGTLTWLDYTRLVPEVLEKQTVRSYKQAFAVSDAPDFQKMVVQEKADIPSFEVVDIREKEIKSSVVTLPASLYSEATTQGVTHGFAMDEWDEDGRYLLVKHSYRDSHEWIIFDTENLNNSVNISRLLSINVSDAHFSGTSGNILYGLTDGVIRRLDVSNATISRGLVSNVSSFELYDTNIITYVGRDGTDTTKQVAGIYREGDQHPHVLRTVAADVPLHITTARYHNDDYIAIAEGLGVTVLKGNYPSSTQNSKDTMEMVFEFTASSAISTFNFSPNGNYLLAQSGLAFMTYEVEYERHHIASIETSETSARPLFWLDDAHLGVVYDGHLSMRDFDGTNAHVIMPVHDNFNVTLSQNGRYLYGLNNTDGTYRLERVIMIIEQ